MPTQCGKQLRYKRQTNGFGIGPTRLNRWQNVFAHEKETTVYFRVWEFRCNWCYFNALVFSIISHWRDKKHRVITSWRIGQQTNNHRFHIHQSFGKRLIWKSKNLEILFKLNSLIYRLFWLKRKELTISTQSKFSKKTWFCKMMMWNVQCVKREYLPWLTK